MNTPTKIFISLFALMMASACATSYPTYPVSDHPVNNSPGRPTVYEDVGSPGRVAGIGIESQDIVSMTDKMVRDMLATPVLADRKVSPRVIIDSEYFRNEGSSRINKNMITDRLRVELNRAAQGRMIFAGRHYSDMVNSERSLKREGGSTASVDTGTIGLTKATLGGDFRLGGRITTLDAVNSYNGMSSRTHQIIYEMVDLETGQIVWSGIYDFKKTAQDDVIYR
jgi:PBP1b-binding outer membrane lipoprotein LpoB